ncbi:MAG: hypothetical protein FJ215_11705 [Ignavibacteria bacterium]|nr:hypothetical protein [Ignavibacteria bacterium]
MNTLKQLPLLFLLVQVTLAQTALDQLRPALGEKVGTCPQCNMDVFENMLTRVETVTGDLTVWACGLGCAVAMRGGNIATSMRVVDFTALAMIDAHKAWFVTGSVIIPARAMMPVLAFASKEAAVSFAATYGGTARDYDQMMELVKKAAQERRR